MKKLKNETKGALAWSVVDAAMEIAALPEFYTLPPPLDVVPSLGKGLVPLTAVVPLAYGEKKHKPKIAEFGRGAAVYGMGSFVSELSRRVLLRNFGLFTLRSARARTAGLPRRAVQLVPLSGAMQGRYGSTSRGYNGGAAMTGNAQGRYGRNGGSVALMKNPAGSYYPRR